MKSRATQKYVFLVLAMLFVFFGFIRAMLQNPQQEHLLQEIKDLAGQKLVQITIEQDQVAHRSFQMQITNADEISHVQALLRKAYKKTVGSHNGPVYECTLIFRLTDGRQVKFLGSVHQREEADLYLWGNFWVKQPDGTYSRTGAKPVRIPGLGSWIVEREPRGKL